MLVLNRLRGQAIRIGSCGQVTIKILGIHKGKVRVGVEAPKNLLVDREEIYQQRKKEPDGSYSTKSCDQDGNNNDEGTPLC